MAGRSAWVIWGKFAILAWGGAAIALLGSQALFGRLHPADYGTARVMVPTIATAIAMIWCCAMTAMGFRRLDEYQQAAARFAWTWGGSIGVAVSGVAYIFIGLGGLHWLDPQHWHLGRDLFRAFQMGYLVAILSLLLGFLVARLLWQVSKR